MIFLPDTNACSHFMRGHPGITVRWLAEAPRIRLPVIVVAEPEYGADKSGSRRQVERLAELARTLPGEPFTREDAAAFGRLRGDLERRGEIIGGFDLLIAAQGLRLGATVVTHNLREFCRVTGLKVEDWQSA
jgi:tRNA(fMet)-specific endonuclease VapC